MKQKKGRGRGFFETKMAEQLPTQLKALIEQALVAERDYYLQLNYRMQCEGLPNLGGTCRYLSRPPLQTSLRD